jgi:hypothetical protein
VAPAPLICVLRPGEADSATDAGGTAGPPQAPTSTAAASMAIHSRRANNETLISASSKQP